MKKLPAILLFILITGLPAAAQGVRLSGKLYDRDDKKAVAGGAVTLNPGNQTVITGLTGEFIFNTLPGAKQILTRVLGYKPSTIRLNLTVDTSVIVYIQISPIELSEVTITGDSMKNVQVTPHGSIIITPAAIRESPKQFSEPDLLKSVQMLPGVVAGRDGTSDIYVRGGGLGQNVVLANGCYFFLPGHLLGIVSPYDLDFLESAELYKDYFPPELGGGASSVISLDFKQVRSDSLRAQMRFGLLSSGVMVETPLKNSGWDLTAGLKRGNYSLYAPLLKKIVASDVGAFLPPDKYSFYDGFIRLSKSSPEWGNFSYLFFGNYDRGKEESITMSQAADTLIKYTDGIKTGWNNMVHAVQWYLPQKSALKWRIDLNYNRISMGRIIYSESEKYDINDNLIESSGSSNQFSPAINSFGTTVMMTGNKEKFSYSTGITGRFRLFDPNTISYNNVNDSVSELNIGKASEVAEPAAFASSTIIFAGKFRTDAGLRLSSTITKGASFLVAEPRLRIAYNSEGSLSPHLNYVRLSQTDHSVEGSNAGLRNMLWLPVSKEFGPEISDVVSAGFQGRISNDISWTLDAYYKKIAGMVDFKPGASFIFDTSFVDLLDRINGRAYGAEAGIIKRTGKLTGSLSYTYSRSKREWYAPEGLMWIPSGADRPHNFNLMLKYYFSARTSFGMTWVYQSGAPATIYMHETSYGEFFETKNNIRYFDYHRLDLSVRHIIPTRWFSIMIDADIYNAYNRKNTFYFRETFDEAEQVWYFKNISLFPIMPSLTVTIKY